MSQLVNKINRVFRQTNFSCLISKNIKRTGGKRLCGLFSNSLDLDFFNSHKIYLQIFVKIPFFPVVVLYSVLIFGIGYASRVYSRERMRSHKFPKDKKASTIGPGSGSSNFTAAFNRQFDDVDVYATIN